jgi:hypothetical protein
MIATPLLISQAKHLLVIHCIILDFQYRSVLRLQLVVHGKSHPDVCNSGQWPFTTPKVRYYHHDQQLDVTPQQQWPAWASESS